MSPTKKDSYKVKKQEKWVLAKGASVESSVAAKEKYQWILGPAVPLALRAPQLREVYVFAKTALLKPFFLGS